MKPSEHPWLPKLKGQTLGDYVLDRYIGCGKIGYVYEAHMAKIPEVCHAVKIIPRVRNGWVNELRKVAQLSTVPNVVHFHYVGTDRILVADRRIEVQYTVWDYIAPGKSLADRLAEKSAIPASFAFTVTTTILKILHACRSRGIVRHGDLHAGNILIADVDHAQLDSDLLPTEQIYVADFGYGASEGGPKPKDDFVGLSDIINRLFNRIQWESTNTRDRQLILGIKDVVQKVLREPEHTERSQPIDILRAILALTAPPNVSVAPFDSSRSNMDLGSRPVSVGQYQVSEMFGDDWALWRALFVPSVPARSRILEPDIASVVTGPRGCGKTMLFRRLSERLMVECGKLEGYETADQIVAFYVNANDFADAFAHYPDAPSAEATAKLICYTHLCILGDLLAVEASRRRLGNAPSANLFELLQSWFGTPSPDTPLIKGEDKLERYRLLLEVTKRSFLAFANQKIEFPAFAAFGSHSWLKDFVPAIRKACPWVGSRMVFIFVDDYTTPRVSQSMQRTLNRLFFQRSSDFVCKIATEAATTFLAEDFSGKLLQDGDDYRLVDLGEESLFMSDTERHGFLSEVFRRRLSSDQRVAPDCRSLETLFGPSSTKKTEFARLLRSEGSTIDESVVLRGAAKRKALYYGSEVFSCLWSGDTRLLIQLVQDVLDESNVPASTLISKPILPELQDRAFRNRGGQWLDMQTRNQPTDVKRLEQGLALYRKRNESYQFTGRLYGAHLKAVVEAFVKAARVELLGPAYVIQDGDKSRTVPKMAFRIEVTDEFRLNELATEVYRDLIRYGLFMRDARGKSVRGAMVPRLYLRRLLLPYCVLPLSKRDSVSMSCETFHRLLLHPDEFIREWMVDRKVQVVSENQIAMDFAQRRLEVDSIYDDTAEEIGVR